MSRFRDDKISTYVFDILIQCIVMYKYKFQYQYKYHRSDKLGRKLLKETKRSHLPEVVSRGENSNGLSQFGNTEKDLKIN